MGKKIIRNWSSGNWLDKQTCESSILTNVYLEVEHHSKKEQAKHKKKYDSDLGPGRIQFSMTARLSDCSRLIEWGKVSSTDGGFKGTKDKINRAIKELETLRDNIEKAEEFAKPYIEQGYKKGYY